MQGWYRQHDQSLYMQVQARQAIFLRRFHFDMCTGTLLLQSTQLIGCASGPLTSIKFRAGLRWFHF